ncbi:MAG: PAS domain-containing protein [bacterium]|nr:PAS domain-containing protein [bacterium]
MAYNDEDTGIAPIGHPIYILMEEHKLLLGFTQKLVTLSKDLKSKAIFGDAGELMSELKTVVGHFKSSPNHYLREENVIFPLLDKKGFSGPPAVMWQEHDQIRTIEKNLYKLLDDANQMNFADFCLHMERTASSLSQMLQTHFYKENNILFPTAMELLSEEEWKEAVKEFEKIGYCPFTPGVPKPSEITASSTAKSEGGLVQFDTGALSPEVLEAIFSTLPVEITFVDKDDQLRFFSETKDPIFPRSKAALGLKVQNCHPQKSIHLVNKILEDFKTKKSDVASFWINMQGKLVYIRYFAVRNREGDYLGCMEVTQNITELKNIEGEKRLL